MDKLALEEAGFRNVVSVPDGAPAKVKETAVPSPDADTKYSYLWNCRALLDQATRILMATDNDPPGHALAEELARRLGKTRRLAVAVVQVVSSIVTSHKVTRWLLQRNLYMPYSSITWYNCLDVVIICACLGNQDSCLHL